MKLRNLLGKSPVLVIKRVHESPPGVDFMIVHPQMPKGQRVRTSGFLKLDDALKQFAEVQAKYKPE